MIVALAIITFVPDTVLWLPRLHGLQGLARGLSACRRGRRQARHKLVTALAAVPLPPQGGLLEAAIGLAGNARASHQEVEL